MKMIKFSGLHAIAIALLLASGCSKKDNTQMMNDAGQTDGGEIDGSTFGDASSDGSTQTDGGTDDLGTSDLGTADLGTADLGTADLGTADLGTADLGTADLGTADLGTADLGTTDLGTGMDGMVIIVGGDAGDDAAADAATDATMSTNFCATNNGGCDLLVTCTSGTLSAICGACPSGYSGDGTLCTDINECATLNGGCDVNATCNNTVGSFTCSCGPGFQFGLDMHTCNDIDECTTMNGGCDPITICTNIPGSRVCGACPSGYTGTGDTGCVDVNECLVNNGGCANLVTCNNTPGGFTCGSCPTGFTGDGVTCTDINECTAHTDNCDPLAGCTNTVGSFTCGMCPSGYTGADGTVCTDVNECTSHTDNCDMNATCANTAGSFTCGCNHGYTGSGTTCADVNECMTNNGGCAQNCTNTVGSFTCSCTSGFTLDRNHLACDDVNECNTANGGCAQTCMNNVGSFSCGCNSGYTLNMDGVTCDDVNECATNNGGCDVHSPCTNTVGSFSCGTCYPGYVGNGATGCMVSAGQIVAGVDHTCAIVDGAVYCWGYNGTGQLGTAEPIAGSVYPSHYSPVRVMTGASTTLNGATQITALYYGSCALLNDGTVWCWGNNSNGELGNGTSPANSNVAVQVSGISNAVAISGGNQHACAALSDGTMKCWGANGSGQLGDGSMSAASSPVTTLSVSTAVGVAAGTNHTCALLQGGAVYCWGANSQGQLGDGTIASRATPNVSPTHEVAVFADDPAVQITAGTAFTCGVGTSGAVYCWGSNGTNQLGRILGSGITSASTAAQVSGLSSGVAEVHAGPNGGFSCALKRNGTVACWGANGSYQIGNGTNTNAATPSLVSGAVNTRVIGVGSTHVVTLANDGQLRSWGLNNYGQLGDGTIITPRPTEVRGATLFNTTSVDVGGGHACAIYNNGNVACWGRNTQGELGNGSTESSYAPRIVTGLSHVTKLALGYEHTCAITAGHTVSCWGYNNQGQVGDGSSPSQPHYSPTSVPSLSGVVDIAAGAFHTCAVTGDGNVYCWGADANSQLGDGGGANVASPQLVPGISHIAAIAAGASHTCVLSNSGVVTCWGLNTAGECGIGTISSIATPTIDPSTVTGLTGPDVPVAIAAGGNSSGSATCVLLRSGAMKCWGLNTSSQLGSSVGDVTSHPTATAVSGISGASGISVGPSTTCASFSNGTAKCWGNDTFGQIGNGAISSSPQAPRVVSLSNIASIVTGGGNTTPTNDMSSTCAVDTSGILSCWGGNAYGRLGTGQAITGSTGNQPTPTALSALWR